MSDSVFPPTVIPNIDAPDWAERILALFPRDWTSKEAREPGGKLYSLFFAIGNELERIIDNVEYDRKATRVATAVDSALDAVAKDFFGDVYPADVKRATGEPDESFRKRIQASLLLPAATRQSLIDLLTRLTGEAPRVMEPWSPQDTSCWDFRSYFDYDSVENPSRLGDPSLKYQGFLESILPPFGDQGDNPVYAFDIGAAWDTPVTCFIDAKASWWMTVARIDALINRTKVFGTTVWRKYRGYPLSRFPLGGTVRIAEGQYQKTVEVFPVFAGAFVVLANANWNTEVSYICDSNSQFRLVFSTVAPAGAQVDWVAAPISIAGVGTGPVEFEAERATIGVQEQYQNWPVFVAPNWNTNFWLHSRSQSQAVIRFSTPAPLSSSISYQFFEENKSGRFVVPAGSPAVSIPILSRDPFQAFVLPTWNTSVDVDKTPEQLTVSFSVPPEDDAFIFWGLHES